MPKEAFYFSHDSNARNDPKILSMRCDYGLEGYAMYFMIVECLREEESYKLKLDDNTCRALAMQMHCKVDAIKKFINDCINCYDLFLSDDKEFWSNSLLRRMEKMHDIREKRRLAAAKRWDSDANGMQMHSKSNAKGKQTDANKKEKEKERKDIYSADADFLWGLYPEKKGKKDAMAKLPKLIDQYGKYQIERCIKRYLADVDRRRKSGFSDLRYKNGSTFFNSGYMDYLDENVPEEKPEPVKKPSGRHTVSLLELVKAKEERERHGQSSGS
mgnify:CR=1 FL=1